MNTQAPVAIKRELPPPLSLQTPRTDSYLEQEAPNGGPDNPGVDIIVTTLPRWGGGGSVQPGGSDDGMTITITTSSGSSGTDDSELQAIVAKCVKK